MKAIRDISTHNTDMQTAKLFSASFTYPKFEHIDQITRCVATIINMTQKEEKACVEKANPDYITALFTGNEAECKSWDFDNHYRKLVWRSK